MKKSKILFLSLLFFLISFNSIKTTSLINLREKEDSIDFPNGERSLKVNGLTHAPIIINANDEFNSTNGVVKGDGSETNPYVIANWEIDANGSGSCISISETTAYYEIKKCTLFNSGNDWKDAGIYLSNSGNAKIYANRIFNNTAGIFLSSSNNNFISKNNCSLNDDGICLRFSNSYNKISENYCAFNSQNGIYLDGSSNNNISENNCFSNSFGIYLSTSTDNAVSRNNCSLNMQIGIYLNHHNIHNKISGNICSSNSHGISLEFLSNNNNISENNCILNSYGIYLYYSRDNLIWGNILSNNTKFQAHCERSNENNLDYNGRGNYWSDYRIRYPRASNDGYIWDNPYKIHGPFPLVSSSDHYPLVCPDGGFLDEIPPKWGETPTDKTINVDESFKYDVDASDNVMIDHYWINNTIDFKINQNGQITNITELIIGSYWIEIRAYDTSDNSISKIIKITVKRFNIGFIIVIASISVLGVAGGLGFYFKKIKPRK